MQIHRVRALLRAGAVSGVVLIAGSVVAPGRGFAAGASTGTVTGVVFNDYNANGIRDTSGTMANAGGGTTPVAVDQGVGSVSVRAIDADGDQVGSAVTAADGSYTLTVAGAKSQDLRIEFSSLPAGFQPGPLVGGAGSTVQFVQMNATGVDLGIARPQDYCQNDPTLITSCFISGSPTDPTRLGTSTLRSIPYSGGVNAAFPSFGSPIPSAAKQPAASSIGTYDQIGSVYSIAVHRESQRVFSGAYYKPNLRPIVPVAVSPAYDYDGNGSADTSIDIHQGGTTFGAGGPGGIYISGSSVPFVVLPAGDDPAVTHPEVLLSSPPTNAELDLAWAREVALAGAFTKVGLGDIDVSEDGSTLYAVNLADRRIYHVPLVGNPPAPIGAGQVAGLTRSPQLTTAQVPCSDDQSIRPMGLGEHNGVLYVGAVCTSDGLSTIVKYDPASGGFTGTALSVGAYSTVPGCCFFGWYPLSYQQWAWPSDIAFDGDDMVIAFRAAKSDLLALATGIGEILRACASVGGAYVLESNGTCGSVTTAGASTARGPGGGEFYFQDDGEVGESALGGIAQVPGFPNVAITAYDAFTVYEGNISWMNHDDGTRLKTYSVYQTSTEPFTLGKQSGLGDLEAMCDMAPIQIGNRVWFDADGDGVQDADESPVSGVTVLLKDLNGVTIATAVTDAIGGYSFSNHSGSPTAAHRFAVPGLSAMSTYTIEVPAGQTELSGYRTTTANVGGDTADSDGTVVATNGATASIMTAGFGFNDHTIDFGFAPVPVTTTSTSTTSTTSSTTTSTTVEPSSTTTSSTTTSSTTTSTVEPTSTTSSSTTTSTVEPSSTTSSSTTTSTVQPSSTTSSSTTSTTTAPTTVSPTTSAPGMASTTSSTEPTVATTAVVTTVVVALPTAPALIDPSTAPQVTAPDTTAPATSAVADSAVPTLPAGTAPPKADGPTAHLKGVVFVDSNQNGVRDPDEIAIAGATVEVRDSSGRLVGTAVTDAQGEYEVTNLQPGPVTVTVTDGVPPEYSYLSDRSVLVEVRSAGTTRSEFRLTDVGANLALTGASVRWNLTAAFGALITGFCLVRLSRLNRRRV